MSLENTLLFPLNILILSVNGLCGHLAYIAGFSLLLWRQNGLDRLPVFEER